MKKLNEKGKIWLLLPLIMSVMGLGGFTAVSMGVFNKSDAKIAAEALKSADFSEAQYGVVLPGDFAATNSNGLSERLVDWGASKTFCSLGEDRFKQLIGLPGVTADYVNSGNRNVAIAVVDKKTDIVAVEQILSGSDQALKCRNVKTGQFLFFQTSPSLSYQSAAERG